MTSKQLTERQGLSRSPDLYLSLGAVVLGAGVLVYALSLPTLGDGMPGPGLFPGIIASGFILFGVALAVRAWATTRKDILRNESTEAESTAPGAGLADGDEPTAESAVSDVETDQDSISTGRAWVNGLVLLAVVIGYIVLAESLGFLITMFLVSLVIMFLLKAKPIAAVLTSLVLSFGMWAVFERGLQVQLPDGLLW